MSWVKLDTGFLRHPKVLALSDKDTVALIRAWSWCAEFATDGHIGPGQYAAAGLSSRQVETLLGAGLLDPNGLGVVVHDWLEYNLSRADVEERRRREREKKRRQRSQDDDVSPRDTKGDT